MGGDFSAKSFAIAAERTGFDSLWCGDHVQHYIDGIATLGCFAGCTERITIGSNVIVAPFRSAASIAKGISSIALSAERPVIAGIGVGGEFPAEFQATGANLRTRGAYTDEAIEVIRKLWQGERVSFHGRFNHFDKFKMEPMPTSTPQLWVGGRSDAALRRVARHGDGYIPYLVSAEQLSRRYSRLQEYIASEGRAANEITYACTLVYMPGDNADDALAKVMDGRFPLKGLNETFVRNSFLLGDVHDCAKRIAEYFEAGAEHIVLGCPPGNEFECAAFMENSERLRQATASTLADMLDTTARGA